MILKDCQKWKEFLKGKKRLKKIRWIEKIIAVEIGDLHFLRNKKLI